MQETFTDWTLVSLSPFRLPWMVAFGLAVLAGTALVLWSYRGGRRPLGLMAMRTLTALLVIGFITEPALQLRAVRRIKNRLAVVVDRSRSMTLAASDGKSRYEHLQAAVGARREALRELSGSHILEFFDLEGPLSDGGLNAPPSAEQTDLVSALEQARNAGAGRPLAGLVLISDGADNAGLEGRPGKLSDQAKSRLKGLSVPVNTVDVSRGQGFTDVSIAEVVADEFAFVHNTLEIEVEVEATGYDTLTVPVTLRREGDVVATQEAALAPGKPARVVFKTKPDKIGEFVYSASVPQFAGEAIEENNTRSFVLQVIRDKIRVLQVAGRPSWDERFLRQNLKENPNVDLISFFILRTPTDDATVPEHEMSLIPFPVAKLFTTELRSFDVVIFQNFDYRPYPMARYLKNIRDAVHAGLGFVMIGGDQSFAGGGYQGTALADILPVVLDAQGLHDGVVKPALTESGRRHPVTDLTRGAGNNDTLWRSLPTWSSYNVTVGTKPQATALVYSPDGAASSGRPAPLVAVMDVEEGRSMALLTDSMWRWRFSAKRDGGASDRAYHRFWSNVLRWLVKDPEHARVRVTPSKRRFEVQESAEVGFAVLGLDYQPVPYAHVRATLEHSGRGVIRTDEVTAGDGGLARLTYENLSPGAYRMKATAVAGGKQIGDGTGVFVVESRSVELARGAPRPDLLARIASITDGKHLALADDFWEDLRLIDPEVIEIDRRRNIELWDNGWAMVLAILLLAMEWAMRRRSGYL